MDRRAAPRHPARHRIPDALHDLHRYFMWFLESLGLIREQMLITVPRMQITLSSSRA